jgi:Ca-activated chloride channel family protein
MRLTDPLALVLLALVPVYLWMRWPRRGRPPRTTVALPALSLLDRIPRAGRERWLALPVILRAAALTLMIVAIARPRMPGQVTDERLRGRNVMLALDISSSMKARDLGDESRLETAKRVLAHFASERRNDFMGLVLFASSPFTQAPLTNDPTVLGQLISTSDIGLLPDGTAIGSALAMAENQLKDLPRNSGVIVLVTDGGNNTGTPDPITAASIARAIGVRIYAIGVGAAEGARPAFVESDAWWRRGMSQEEDSTFTAHDEQLLRRVAEISGGAYFRATDASMLSKIMIRIDELEKSELHVRDVRSWRELFVPLATAALLLLSAELTLRSTWLRTLP